MVAEGGPEAVGVAAVAVLALIVANEGAVELADVLVDRAGFAVGVVVVAGGDDEGGVPAGDQGGDQGFFGGAVAEIPDDGEGVVFWVRRRRGS